MKETDFRTDVLPLKDRLFRLALRMTLDRHEAEDITQDTLMRIWERRDEWHQIANMEAYGMTIARHLALDAMKKHAPRLLSGGVGDDAASAPWSGTEAELASTDPLPDELLDRKQQADRVRRLMDQLPEVQRTVMLLRDTEGYRYDEIAQVTGLTETQVKVYLHRARKKIRESLFP